MAEQILFDVREGVATLTLNRPERLNALTGEMTRGMLDTLKTCARNDAIRCLVITGAGRGFSAGQDLEEFQAAPQPFSVSEHLRHGFNRVILGLRELEKPVIGKINGVAAGAGLGIALATDLRIASDQARFMAAFIGIGLAPDSGVSWALAHLLGPARLTKSWLWASAWMRPPPSSGALSTAWRRRLNSTPSWACWLNAWLKVPPAAWA